ncbi:MAG TPA: HAD hydrolase-like protein [Gemmatimonadales bacterium]|nr:HAD hydrolase-like protein [Gemmatimonadales bacterium]
MPSAPIPPRPDLVVCDLAGTTIYDRGEVPAAFEQALRETGLTFDAAEVSAWRGASKREVVGRLVARRDGAADGAVDRVYRRFRELLLRQLAAAGPLSLPGVHETLIRLKADRCRLAVTTGFDRDVVETVLAGVPWTELLDARVSGDDVPQGRPAPFMIFRAMEQCGVVDVRRVAVVGDTRLDLEAAWNAGAGWRIGVLTGAHDRATLAAAPHTHLCDAITALPSLWGQ